MDEQAQDHAHSLQPIRAEEVGTSCNFLLIVGCAAFAIGGAGLWYAITEALKQGFTPQIALYIAVSVICVVNGVAVYVFGGMGLNAMATAKNSEIQVKLLKRIAFQVSEKQGEVQKPQ